jgi:hypothetical protein
MNTPISAERGGEELPSGLGGFGPWYCTLLFNTSKNSKKQTHLVAHSTPSLFPMIMNRVSAKRPPPSNVNPTQQQQQQQQHSGIGWVIMQQIGPFKSWGNCIAFLALWTNKTRGKTRRLERGVNLFTTYATAEEEKLTMWTRMDTKEDVITKHNNNQQQRTQRKSRIRKEQQQQQQQKPTEGKRRKMAEDGAILCEKHFFNAMDKIDNIFSINALPPLGYVTLDSAVLDSSSSSNQPTEGSGVRIHTIKGFDNSEK